MSHMWNAMGVLVLLASCLHSDRLRAADATTDEVAVELGKVHWEQDFEKAKALAAKTGKPLLVLFDEIPGCGTCRSFGEGPLSHPEVVKTAKEFVATYVRNNVEGPEREICRKYHEPAWNNPVVRFLKADDGTDLIPRKSGVYTTEALLARMRKALEAAGRPVPATSKPVAEVAPLTPQAARKLIPHAAAMSEADARKLFSAASSPKASDLKSQPLTLLLLTLSTADTETSQERQAQFRYVGRPKPAALAAEFARQSTVGRLLGAPKVVTCIHPDRITECTCTVKDGAARGTVSFRVPGLYEGKIHYVARLHQGRWRVEEFSLPAYGLRTTVDSKGSWKIQKTESAKP